MDTTTPTKKVLVADDEASCRSRLRSILERRGMDVTEAKDGREALAQLQENVYSVAFLDLMMPYMDGFEVIKNVRTQKGDAAPYLVLMTAQAQHQEEPETGYGFLPDLIVPKLADDAQVEELLTSKGF